MTRTQFQRQTYQRLISRRAALRAALAGDQTLLHSLSQGVGDEIDAIVVSEQAELRSQLAEVESRELDQIERALLKLRSGHYGRCESCQRPIAPLRLKYLPYAADCISCARSEERRDAAVGGHRPVNRISAYSSGDDAADARADESRAELEIH